MEQTDRQASLENPMESLEKLTKEQTAEQGTDSVPVPARDRQASLENRMKSLEKLTKEQSAEQGTDSVPASDRQARLENRMESLEKSTWEKRIEEACELIAFLPPQSSKQSAGKANGTGKASAGKASGTGNGEGKSTGKGKLFMGTLPPGVEVIGEHTRITCEKAQYKIEGDSWERL